MVGVDMEMLIEFAELDVKIRELNQQIKAIKSEKLKMEDTLLEQMTDSGVGKISLEGLGTLYIRSQIWPKFKEGKTRMDVMQAMIADGISDDFIKEDYNTQSFAAYIREVEKSGDSLPQNLMKVVEASERFNLVRVN